MYWPIALSTDALLFSIVLVPFGISTALRVPDGGMNFTLVGVAVAALGLAGSVVSRTRRVDSQPQTAGS